MNLPLDKYFHDVKMREGPFIILEPNQGNKVGYFTCDYRTSDHDDTLELFSFDLVLELTGGPTKIYGNFSFRVFDKKVFHDIPLLGRFFNDLVWITLDEASRILDRPLGLPFNRNSDYLGSRIRAAISGSLN